MKLLKPTYSLPFQVISQCPNLRKISLNGLKSRDLDFVFAALALKAENLKNLSLRLTERKDDYFGVFSCMSQLVNLQKLCVSSSHFVNDDFLQIIGKNCVDLKQLDINCKYI